MLCDPKWEKTTKADPLTLPAFIAWLEMHDANKQYDFLDCQGECLVGQYMAFIGVPWGETPANGAGNWAGTAYAKVGEQIFGCRPFDIPADRPHTFGAALARARAALSSQQGHPGE